MKSETPRAARTSCHLIFFVKFMIHLSVFLTARRFWKNARLWPSPHRSASRHVDFVHLAKFQRYTVEKNFPRHSESFSAEIFRVMLPIRRAILRRSPSLELQLLQ